MICVAGRIPFSAEALCRSDEDAEPFRCLQGVIDALHRRDAMIDRPIERQPAAIAVIETRTAIGLVLYGHEHGIANFIDPWSV
jgi:hypothetical protein